MRHNHYMDILKLLHHRSPYLFIKEVSEHSPHHLHAFAHPTMDDFYQPGHFPGAPVVPGAILQEMTTQAAGLLITHYYSPVKNYDSEKTQGWALGVLRSIHHAKYKSFARPNDHLVIKVTLIDHQDHLYRFKAQVYREQTKIMHNQFSLINISYQKLFNG